MNGREKRKTVPETAPEPATKGEGPCDIRKATFTVTDRMEFLGRLKSVADRTGTRIVCFNADALAGEEHARAALAHAFRSFRDGDPIARTFEMEALLYASGCRQCSGTDRFSIHNGPNRAFVAICPEHPVAAALLGAFMQWETGDWETISPEKQAVLRELFSITPEELATVGQDRIRELVLERVALLDVYR